MERNKEGDGFVRLWWGETKEADSVGGARLTIETDSDFPTGVKLIENPLLSLRFVCRHRRVSGCDGSLSVLGSCRSPLDRTPKLSKKNRLPDLTPRSRLVILGRVNAKIGLGRVEDEPSFANVGRRQPQLLLDQRS